MSPQCVINWNTAGRTVVLRVIVHIRTSDLIRMGGGGGGGGGGVGGNVL